MTLREQMFTRKPVHVLLAEIEGEHGLRRVLGPVALTALGVGCIIGAGIFVLTGLAANQYAGPALVLSFVVAGIGCTLAGAVLRGVRGHGAGGRAAPTPTRTRPSAS